MLVWLFALVTVLLVTPVLIALARLAKRLNRQQRQGLARRPAPDPAVIDALAPPTRKKPDWVLQEVLRLKALMGKSFVSDTIRNRLYALLNITRELRDQRPAPVGVNRVWGVDLTFVRDHHGTPRPVLGVVDHGSRVCTRLAAVINKRTWTLVGHLCLAIGQHGKPSAIRTDNELIFNSAVFTTFLRLVGIHHQRIPICAPWCNGRIESFFGRIKPYIRQIHIHSPAGLQNTLDDIRHFFNHVRTHQNLAGLTPAEVWHGLTLIDIAQTTPKSAQLVQMLDGLLVGYHVRR